MRKLMFHKTELYGKWFREKEIDNDFTEKVPQHTNQMWDEESNDWVLKPIPEPEPYEEIEEDYIDNIEGNVIDDSE